MIAQDLRFAVRSLAKTPLFSTVAVVTLALGIGATTTIFGVANWTLMRDAPGVRDPEELVAINLSMDVPEFGTVSMSLPYRTYEAYRRAATRLSGVAGAAPIPLHLGSTGGAAATRVEGELVTAEYFSLLGVRMLRGRGFVAEEGDPASGRQVAVLSHRLWRQSFGEADVVGKQATINGKPFTVVGIAPEGFHGVEYSGSAQLWVPTGAHRVARPIGGEESEELGGTFFPRLIARPKPGVTAAHVREDVERIMADTRRPRVLIPGFSDPKPVVSEAVGPPLHIRPKLRSTMTLLLAGVGLVLLIACANVANLLLARATGRGREIAIRRSLGASNRRLTRQLLVESGVLAVTAGALGVLLATWGSSLLEGVRLANAMPPLPEIAPDGRVLAFTLVVSLLTAVLFGAPPALRAARVDAAAVLRAGARAGHRRSRLQRALVGVQVALSFVLVVGTGLFVRTVDNLRAVDLGFQPDNVLGFSIAPDVQGYRAADGDALLQRLRDRLLARPGIQSVAVTAFAAFAGGAWTSTDVRPADGPTSAGLQADVSFVTTRYFQTLGIPLLRGRDFAPGDFGARASQAVINATLARRLWPNAVDPVGRRIVWAEDAETPSHVEVIGVVADSKSLDVTKPPRPVVYRQFETIGGHGATIFVRSSLDRAALVALVRAEVRALDPNLPVYDVLSLRDRVDRTLSEPVALARVLSAFGLLGLVLAAVGLYAVIAYTVTQRTRELAIHVALGAPLGRIRSAVVGEGLLLAALGTVAGFGAAFALARVVSSRLYGVSSADPLTFTLSALAMLVVAAGASYLPARRATRVDPMLVLRGE